MRVPIMSKAVFDIMDKNKDGLVSKGELRLAQKGFKLKDLAEILQVKGRYTRMFFLEVLTDSATIYTFFHATLTVFSVRIIRFFQ